MRVAVASTRDHHPDPGLRTRVYDAGYEHVFASATQAMAEMHTLELAEADPRRGVIEAWVRLAPFAGLPMTPPGEVKRRKHPHAVGKGWFERFDPRLAQGWVSIEVKPGPKGTTTLDGRLSLNLPFAGPLAGLLLKNYLRWHDVRRGEPVKPGVLG